MHDSFDPLSPEFLADPFAVLATLPRRRTVLYAPASTTIVTRFADVEHVFLDKTFSAVNAQLPLDRGRARGTGNPRRRRAPPQPVDRLRSTNRPRPPAPPGPSGVHAPARQRQWPEPVTRPSTSCSTRSPSDRFDLVASLTFPLPASIVFSFIGVPMQDTPQLKA